MEPKNVMLLGFVNKAVEYLDKHLDDKLDNSMTELKNIDLESLKKELGNELGASLGSMSSTIETLLNAGGEAFDTFMDRSKSESLSSEFDRMFDIDLDEEKPVEKKEELQDLLSYYHLDSAFEVDEKYLDQDEEEVVEEKSEEVPEEAPEEESVEETQAEETVEVAEEESETTEDIVTEEIPEEVIEDEPELEEETVSEETLEETEEETAETVPEVESKTEEDIITEEISEEIAEETEPEAEEETVSEETIEEAEEETVEEVQEEAEEETPEEEVNEEVLEEPASEEETVEETAEEVEEDAVPEEEEEESTFELTDEETQMLQMIAQNVNKKPEERQEDILSGANKELDSIFSELVAAEDELLNKKEEETETEDSEETVEEKITEKPVIIVPSIDSDAFGYIENPLVDVAQPEVTVEEEPEPDPNLVFPEQVEKDDIIQLIKDIQPLSDVYYNKIENFIDLQEKEAREKPKTEEKKDSRYVSTLIDDLKSKMSIEDEKKKEAEEAYKLVYDKIHKTYPYLSNAFIRNVYEMKESIATEYPLGEKIIILHRTVFRNVENLRQYVEIALKHGYAINADEKKMIVDAFKQHVNTDGKVITSIFEVANQSALLNGEYEGYRVLFEDDL